MPSKSLARKPTLTLLKLFPLPLPFRSRPAGAFEDETGNDFVGLAASAWTFTTTDAPAPIDNTAPVVSGLSPADEAAAVAENAKLEITLAKR
jgi:hypothetical protein